MRLRLAVCVLLSVLLVTSADAKNIWRLTDINPGSAGSYPSYLTIFDGQLYFRANDLPHGNNVELWHWTGTTAVQAADILLGPEGSSPADLTACGSTLYFSATGTSGGGIKMWQFDGTTASVVAAWTGNLPQAMTCFGGDLIYRQAHFGADTDLWKFDGAAQTGIYKAGGGNILNPEYFHEYNGLLYFSAAEPVGGEELWRTNGTAAARLTTILLPTGGSSPGNFCVFNDQLYFSAYDGVTGNELWRYTSASNTAELVADLVPGGQYDSGNPHSMAVYNGKLYFSATDGIHGYELWAYDGTNPPGMVAEINTTPDPLNGDDWLMDSDPRNLVVFEGKLYFTATDGAEPGQHGREVWSWDGTQAELEFDICAGPYGSEITEMLVFGDSVFVDADDGIKGRELWQMQFPEPATLTLLGLGALGVLVSRRRR